MEALIINPDLALVHRFIAVPSQPLPVTTSPLARSLGTTLTSYDPLANAVRLTFDQVGPAFRQGAGMVQGGIVTTMLDYAMAFAAMARIETGVPFATLSLTASFLAPARGERFVAEGRIIKFGRRAIFLEAVLSDERSIAQASSTILVSVPGM